jgi:hypothetical protein
LIRGSGGEPPVHYRLEFAFLGASLSRAPGSCENNDSFRKAGTLYLVFKEHRTSNRRVVEIGDDRLTLLPAKPGDSSTVPRERKTIVSISTYASQVAYFEPLS